MDEPQRALESLVAQVGIELAELSGREHALVDDDATAQRREVRLGLVFDPLAREVHVALELVADQTVLGDEHLREHGHLLARRRPGAIPIDGYCPPAENREALVGEHLFDRVDGRVGAVDGYERDAGGVRAGNGQLEPDGRPVEGVGDLHEDSGAVTRVGLRAGGAPVIQAAHGRERLVDDGVTLATQHVDDEPDAARVVLESGVVERG